MTMNYISASEGTANVASGRATFTPASDAAVAPPFEALDRLNNVSQRIDGALSTLIGQLQPYCVQDAVAVMKEPQPDPPARSGLEHRIELEAFALLEMATRLEELIGSLRL